MAHDKALVRLNGDLERAHSLEDFDVKLKRLFNIAQQFDVLKMRPRAEAVYDQALEVIQAIPSLYNKLSYLANMARKFEFIAATAKAQQIREQALELSKRMPEGYEKIDVLRQLGSFQEAIQMTRQCLDSDRKATALIGISHTINQPNQLVSLWQEALAVASNIVDIPERDQSLAYVVQSVPTDQRKISLEQVEELHNQAVQIAAQDIQSLERRNKALYQLALSASTVDQKTQILNRYTVTLPLEDRAIKEYKIERYAAVNRSFEEVPLSDFQAQQWAKEVYQFIYLPSFHASLVIRVWSTEFSHPYLYVTVKLGVQGWGEDSWILTEESSLALFTAIDQNQFWEAVTWDLSWGCDGASWVFEGWRDGQYKILESWSPKEGPAYRLGMIFFNLLPPTLLEALKVY